MGNKKQPVETKKRKKKGRPSLLDLQKRSLRLQKQQEQHKQPKQNNRNPNPNSATTPNPYLKYPNRRSTRRNPNQNSSAEDDDEEEDDSNGKRKEKKLKLVLRIPNGGSDLGESGSDSDAHGGGSRKKRKIEAVEQTARQNSNLKATDEAPQGDPSNSGPTTPLPDKKLLVFILDRLQKKDTYAVFSEPVDPEELPDYNDIIKHPMDFGTVRKKLDSGAYENLEQFESDVFLICSNAMRYNAPDTIYFRQARSIQELAKKDFENLRQESDDNEQEPKTVRRGRPPIKNVMRRIGRPPVDRTGSDFSTDATLANARDGVHSSTLPRDGLRRGSPLDKPNIMDAHRGDSQHRSERNEEYSGSPLKGIPMRNWKKFSTIDENRRDTYNSQSTCGREPSVLTAFEGERKMMLPVGVYMEHAYARSLARFAANLGPAGWEIAAKRIERVLPPGTKFGPGWIGESEAASRKFHPPVQSSSPNPPSQTILLESRDLASTSSAALPPSASASAASTTATSRADDSTNVSESGRVVVKHEGEFGLSGGAMHPKSHLQHALNGFNPGYGFSLQSKAARMGPLARSSEVAMSHSHALNMVSRSGSGYRFGECQQGPAAGKPEEMISESSVPGSSRTPEGQWRGVALNPNRGSDAPDLNVDFRSPGSPVVGMMADPKQQQQPDLALQL